MSDFAQDVRDRIAANGVNSELREAAQTFMDRSIAAQYSYNFSALGRPIIQYPQDMVAIQELIWQVRPDVIVETGIAHGGSLILSASMLALLEYCDAAGRGERLDPANPRRKVVGLDIDIRAPNRAAIEAHPLAPHITMIEGSSIAPDVVAQVHDMVKGAERVLVCLDSNHTHDHVLGELEAYAGLVTPGSYCVVFDTVIEDLPENTYLDRPWGRGDNAKTAVWKYLESHPEFEIDKSIDAKLLISVAPDGFLKRTA